MLRHLLILVCPSVNVLSFSRGHPNLKPNLHGYMRIHAVFKEQDSNGYLVIGQEHLVISIRFLQQNTVYNRKPIPSYPSQFGLDTRPGNYVGVCRDELKPERVCMGELL